MINEKNDCRATKVSMNFIAEHIKRVASKLDTGSVSDLVNNIMGAKKIFLMGAGRSGLAARTFAMRLMHLGFNVHVVGETTAPAVQPEDLVIAVSGSGETSSIANLGAISKKIGSKLATITSNKESTLGNISDVVVIIPGRLKEDLPLGTLFEISALVFLDSVISELMLRTGASESELKMQHAVFE